MKPPVVLVTGALTGIGRATALAFAHEGARLVVSGRRDEVGQELAIELRALGVEAGYVRADVRHEDEVRSLVDQTVARFGRLDDAGAAARQRSECVVNRGQERFAGRIRVRGQQARGRRADEVGGARSSRVGRARQCGRPWSGRDRDAEPVHR